MWFLAGAVLSGVHTVLVVAEIASIGGQEPGKLRRQAIRRYLLRYVMLTVLLAAAMRQSLSAGLAAALGFWVTRWLAVYLGSAGRIDWAWFE